MKKQAFWIVLLLAALLLLPACAAEKHDLLYETEVDGIYYCVRGSSSRAKQVVVKNDEEILFTQSVKVASSVGSRGGDYGLRVLDLNFDGKMDFMLADAVSGDSVSYLCWLQGEDGKYQKSEALSGLCNIEARQDLKALMAFHHTYEVEEEYLDAPASSISCDSATKYVWTDGELTPDIRVSITYYSESDLYCYSVAYFDPEAKAFEDSSDKWLTPEEYSETDFGFLYYFK